MAKFMITALALVAMIGSIGANPVLGLLGNSPGTQGLKLEEATDLLQAVQSLIQTAALQKIRAETDAGAIAVANSAAAAAYLARRNGLTREQAKPIVEEAAMRGAEPVVRRVIVEGARVAIENAYQDLPQGLAQGQGGFGRK